MSQHILVVDDEAAIHEMLASFLVKRGYEVSVAATEDEAQIQAHLADLVILDVALGDTDGMELLTLLKKAHPCLPVIIITAMGFDDGLILEALDRGASGYLSKTLPLEQILMEVQRVLAGGEDSKSSESS